MYKLKSELMRGEDITPKATHRIRNSPELTEFMDSNEAADFLRVSVSQLRNMASRGTLPYYKLNGRNRYSRDELRQLILKNKRGNTL